MKPVCKSMVVICLGGISSVCFASQRASGELEKFYSTNNQLKNKALVRDAVKQALVYEDNQDRLKGIISDANDRLPRLGNQKRELEQELHIKLKENKGWDDIQEQLGAIDALENDMLPLAYNRDVARGAFFILKRRLGRQDLVALLDDLNKVIAELGGRRREQEREFDQKELELTPVVRSRL